MNCVYEHAPKTAEKLKASFEKGSSEGICTEKQRKSILECFSGIAEAWEKCSEPEEKFLPDFVLDAVEGVLDFICADGVAIVDKVYNPDECLGKLILAEKQNPDPCRHEFKIYKIKSPGDYKIIKEEFCQDLLNVQTCYGKIFEKHCPSSPAKNLTVGFYDAFSTPCEKTHT